VKSLPILLVLCCAGCAIERYNKPPAWASAASTHARFFGLKASIPVGGGETVGVLLGWGSSTYVVIPVSTNKIYAATISDTFTLGQGLNPFDTTIHEDLQSGWDSKTVPIPRFNVFAPPKK